MSSTHNRPSWVGFIVGFRVETVDATKEITVTVGLTVDDETLSMKETAENYVTVIANAVVAEWPEANVEVFVHTQPNGSCARTSVRDLVLDEPYAHAEEVRAHVRAIVAGVWERGRWMVEKHSRILKVAPADTTPVAAT